MFKVTHKPTKTDPNSYEIIGDSVDELVDECLKRIRPQSQDFYRNNLRVDLNKKGISLIDRHGGMGNFYSVILESPCASCGYKESGYGKYGELCYQCDSKIKWELNQ